eukprot:10372692-Alexandrium_andersonii.AAC.1
MTLRHIAATARDSQLTDAAQQGGMPMLHPARPAPYPPPPPPLSRTGRLGKWKGSLLLGQRPT